MQDDRPAVSSITTDADLQPANRFDQDGEPSRQTVGPGWGTAERDSGQGMRPTRSTTQGLLSPRTPVSEVEPTAVSSFLTQQILIDTNDH